MERLSRRDFLKISTLIAGGVFLDPSITKHHLFEGTRPESLDNVELLPKEKRTGLLTAENMPVILVPLKKDYFYNYWYNRLEGVHQPCNTYKISGLEFGYKDLYTASDGLGKAVRYTIFPHTMGLKTVAFGLYDKGTIDPITKKYQVTEKFYKNDKTCASLGRENGTEHSIIAEFYPNKNINILEAMRAIDEYQHKIGGFKKGTEYSYLKILDFDNRARDYVSGRTSSASIVRGGGICATATNICKLQTVLGMEITKRQPHAIGSRYFAGPDAGPLLNERNTDATVYGTGYSPDDVDFRWIPNEDGFIKITAMLLPNGKTIKNDIEGLEGDVTIFVTQSWVKNDPGIQTDTLKTIQNNYVNFRTSGYSPIAKAALESKGKMIESILWDSKSDKCRLAKSINPEERSSRFKNEIEAPGFLKDLKELEAIINSYEYSSGKMVGDYIKSFDWYKRQVDRLTKQGDTGEDLENAIKHLNSHANMLNLKQPVQCVGFVILLASLKYKEFNAYNVYDLTATQARDICPTKIRGVCGEALYGAYPVDSFQFDKIVSSLPSVKGCDVYAKKYYIAQPVNTIDEIQVGDLFVNIDTETGHIGAIVGKKTVNGKTVLLMADSNRTSEGKVKVYETDENNFDVVLGAYPWPKVMIRKA